MIRPVVSANGQGYNQGGATQGGASHVGFPYGVVPVMNMGYPHGPPHMLLPYVSSHQGEYSHGIFMCHYTPPQQPMMNC